MPIDENEHDSTQPAEESSQPSLAGMHILQPGTLLKGRYLIERNFGKGGMGIVYLGRDKQLLGRAVVIKTLLHSQSEPWFRKKFRQELEALSRIDHPGVVGILDAGELQDGTLFIVMQFVAGDNLRSAMTAEGMDFKRAANIVKQLGSALTAAHDKGVYHRDLKPENIMLQQLNYEEELVKIIDFGIASVKNSQVAPDSEKTAVVGTLAYMAPEQLLGKPSASSDIYSLGVITYEMLTGCRPFKPGTGVELYELQRAGVKNNPKAMRLDLPEPAQAAILKALSFEPRDRFPHARDFSESLAHALIAQNQSPASSTGVKSEAVPDHLNRETSLLGVNSSQSEQADSRGLEIAHVLFLDIVAYSKLAMDQQVELLKLLQTIVRRTNEFRLAQANNELISLPTGDGMALAFFGDPVAPVRCAVEISDMLKRHTEVKLRMGINSGPVFHVSDINANKNIAGGGINIAQRVMDAGDEGHILLSKSAADVLAQLREWQLFVHDLGQCRVKHGVRVHLFNFYSDQFGNARVPDKIVSERQAESESHKKAAGKKSHNLPLELTPLVGRKREIAEVESLLRKDDVRLITLTGPGGTGKTRLGLEIAYGLIDQFDEGVYFIQLASIADPSLVIPETAKTLGVREVPGTDLKDSLKEFLQEKRTLLLFDNFEQVLPAAIFIGDVLATVPGVKALVTSRAPLKLKGEQEFSVPPLTLPDLMREPSVEELSDTPAVALFLQRARAARADFALSVENKRAVAEICVRLDGLPLAIELAAARIRLFSPQSLLARLGNRLKLLTAGSVDLPPRQRTMRNAIAWSYGLLDDGEKKIFRKLSVFVGGFTIEAAEEFFGQLSDYEVDVIDGLSSLLDNSLLHREERQGESRLLVYETIREYGLDCLEASNEIDQARQAHADLLLRQAEEAEPELKGSRQSAFLIKLESETDNLRAALRWSKEKGEIEKGLRMASAPWRFWEARGHLNEGLQWLKEFLIDCGDDQVSNPIKAKAKALYAAGALSHIKNDPEAATAFLEDALSLYRSMGDKRGIAYSLNIIGLLAHDKNENDQAIALLEEALTLCRELNDKEGLAYSLGQLGLVMQGRGDCEKALALQKDSVAIRRELGDELGIATSLNNLGLAAQDCGDYELANEVLSESLGIFRKMGDDLSTAVLLNNLGEIALKKKEIRRAASLFEESLRLFRESGDEQNNLVVMLNLASAIRSLGDFQRATDLYRDLIEVSNKNENAAKAAAGLRGLAVIAHEQGEAERFARLLGAAESLRPSSAETQQEEGYFDLTYQIADAQSILGEVAFKSAWLQGRAMDVDKAIIYALKNKLN